MITRFTKDIFLQRYAVYFSGSMVVAFLNYLFHPVLSRVLSPEEFGDVQAFLALLAQSALLLGAFSIVAVNITANTDSDQERNAILFKLQTLALWVMGSVVALLILALPTLASFFNFLSPYPLIALALILPITTLNTFRNAYLQGKGHFSKLALGGMIGAGGRVVAATLLALAGFGALGATLGIVISSALLLAYLIYHTRHTLFVDVKEGFAFLEKGSVRKEIRYGLLVLCATALVTLFYTSDVLIVKRYFSPTEAGLYSGISAIAKIIFFAMSPVAAILLSSIKLKNTFRENTRILEKSLAIALLVGGVGICTFYLFYDTVIRLMVGAAYAPAAYLLPQAGLVMALAALANIMVFYFLALRRFFLLCVSAVGAGALAYILLRGHDTIEAILSHLVISLSIILALLALAYAKDYFNNRSRL